MRYSQVVVGSEEAPYVFLPEWCHINWMLAVALTPVTHSLKIVACLSTLKGNHIPCSSGHSTVDLGIGGYGCLLLRVQAS